MLSKLNCLTTAMKEYSFPDATKSNSGKYELFITIKEKPLKYYQTLRNVVQSFPRRFNVEYTWCVCRD